MSAGEILHTRKISAHIYLKKLKGTLLPVLKAISVNLNMKTECVMGCILLKSIWNFCSPLVSSHTILFSLL